MGKIYTLPEHCTECGGNEISVTFAYIFPVLLPVY